MYRFEKKSKGICIEPSKKKIIEPSPTKKKS